MNKKIKKAALSLMIAGTLLMGSGLSVYAKTEESTETTEVTTEQKTTSENATTEAPKETPSKKDTNASEATTEDVTSKDNKYKVRISIALDKPGWYNDKAMVDVKVTKIFGDSKFKVDTVQAKIGSNGSWVDITDDMALEITENCTVYVKVTDMNGNEYEKNRFIKCFDTVAPTLNAAVSEGLLNIMTYDTESGVKKVYVNEYSFTPDENGVVTVRLQKFDASYQYFYIYSIDNAGNSSTVYTVANPYYKENTTEEDSEESTENPADSLPDNGSATVTNPSTGSVTSVTDESGKDIMKEVNKKQFYTIVTKDGQQYFLVIDMSAAYSDDDGVDTTHGNGTVYFLTSVSNDNLLNFVDSDEQTLPHNSVAQGNNINTEEVTPDMDESTTEETTEDATKTDADKKESKGLGNWLYIIIFGVVAVVVIGVKMAGGKKGKPEASDDSMYGEKDETEEEESDYDEEDE